MDLINVVGISSAIYVWQRMPVLFSSAEKLNIGRQALLRRESTPKHIDFSRPFMPEPLTPLYHAAAYGSLSPLQRLRYNQLHALYFNEQTMFFERALAQNVLGYFLKRSWARDLHHGLRQFLDEEERHSAMFLELNRSCAPAWYAGRNFHFIRVPPVAARMLNLVAKRPAWFPFLLWLMHLQEERALFFGRAFLRWADSLEPRFVAVERKHLADEVGHVRWDESLLDLVWPKTGRLLRHLNVRIFAWMIAEYFSTPKRSALRVVAGLVEEFPALRPRYSEFCRQLRELGNDAGFRRSLYCAENVPNTFRRFDLWPEFRSVARAMPGYIPAANA